MVLVVRGVLAAAVVVAACGVGCAPVGRAGDSGAMEESARLAVRGTGEQRRASLFGAGEGAGAGDEAYARRDAALGVVTPRAMLAGDNWPERERASLLRRQTVTVFRSAETLVFFVPESERGRRWR
jgi:hypothetical protein